MALRKNYKHLGKTGLVVSELALGAMTFTSNEAAMMPHADEEESVKIMNLFAAQGGNFLDTAPIYEDSEAVVGRWLSKQTRADWVIATKVGIGSGPNKAGLGRKTIKEAVESSLRNLQTSYIDLYQCHTPDTSTPIEETLRTLDELVRIGKIHHIGLSNFTGYQLQKAVDLSISMGLSPITSLQPQYSLLCRTTEWELLPICKNEGLGILPWSPLAGGWLSGKYKKEDYQTAEGTRLGWSDMLGWKATSSHLATDHTWKVLNVVSEIAKESGHTPSQVSLRWLMQNPIGSVIPIIGARTVAQFEENLGAVGWSLTDDQMKRLNDASALEIPYPWGEFWL